MYLSPYVEEPLNSKVIKSFVSELRSRYVFFVFRDSYVLCDICYEHSMYVSHIAISGNGTQKDRHKTVKLLNIATIFFNFVSTRFRSDLHAFKINSSDILFHSSLITVLSEPIFGWEAAFVLFSKTPHIKGVIIFTNPSARAGYDTRSFFKRSLTGLNSEFSFS